MVGQWTSDKLVDDVIGAQHRDAFRAHRVKVLVGERSSRRPQPHRSAYTRAELSARPLQRSEWSCRSRVQGAGPAPHLQSFPSVPFDISDSQNTYLSANCMIRGCWTEVMRPKFTFVIVPVGLFARTAFGTLNASSRASMRRLPKRKEREMAASSVQVPMPGTEKNPALP